MTPDTNPLPFLTSLRKEADGWANGLTYAMWIAAGATAIWAGGHFFGFFGAISPFLAHTVAICLVLYLAFRSLAALIDYTIYAVMRALTEWLDAAMIAYNSASVGVIPTVEAQPDQREPAVAYLHDFLKRTQKATDSAPLNLTKPVV